jgi:predicted dinucleotide-binding enzyme
MKIGIIGAGQIGATLTEPEKRALALSEADGEIGLSPEGDRTRRQRSCPEE